MRSTAAALYSFMRATALRFVAPSLAGVCLASLLAGLSESAANTSTLFETLAGAGFWMAFALPIGLGVSLVARLILRGWKLERRLGEWKDERGAAPRFCAWAIVLLLFTLGLMVAVFQSMRGLFIATKVNTVVALATPIVVVGELALLAALSIPLVDWFETRLSKWEERRAERGLRALWTPRHIVVTFLSVKAIVATVTWFFILLPSLGHLDISFLAYIAVFLFVLLLVPLAWRRLESLRHARTGLVAASLVGVAICAGAAGLARFKQPYSMLEIWGQTKIAGWSIDRIFDIEELRVDLDLEGIEPVPVEGAEHPNIVLITVDTMRADRSSLHGGKAKMPALKALGAEGTVFERAFAPGNVTRRSLPTLATGLSPRRVRGRVAGWALRLDPRHILLAERLRAGGYDTAGFFCCKSHFGREHKLGLIRGLDMVKLDYDGEPLTKSAVGWLAERKKSGADQKPLFMWAHYIEPHNWEKDHKPEDGARRKKERYDKSLEAVDGFLATMVAGIREELGEDTIIIVTSDHGEGLGDHGVKNHAGTLYNTEIRVPLVVAGPGIKKQRMRQAVGLVDMAPTIMELAGFEAPAMPAMDGLSVAPELRGERVDKLGVGEAYSVMVVDRSVAENQFAVVSGRYKLIARQGSVYELYDLSRDPKESKDIKDDSKELFDAMKARLDRRRRIDLVPPF